MREFMGRWLLFLGIGALALTGVVATAVAELSGDKVGGTTTGNPSEPLPTVSAAELSTAVEVARSSEQVPLKAREQEWDVKYPWPLDVDGVDHAVQFYVEWNEPLSLSGKWSQVQCQGTRIHELDEMTMYDVTTLKVAVDLDERQVLAVSSSLPVPPGLPDDDRPQPYHDGPADYIVTVIDPATGKVLNEVPRDRLSCPPGTEYD